MAWVARGKCKALGKKKSSTPAVVPGAAPALAKAGVGGYIYIYTHMYIYIYIYLHLYSIITICNMHRVYRFIMFSTSLAATGSAGHCPKFIARMDSHGAVLCSYSTR